MGNTYSKISSIVKSHLYPYIRIKNLSLLSYTFEDFFNHIVEVNQIKVLGHHFTQKNIEGLILIDSRGRISLSYESETPKVRQNFTKCHELGHFLLGHRGSFFIELEDKKTVQEETEANYFSACLLMPEIVLLSKIYYSCDSFQKVQDSLEVSKQALYYRLLDLFRFYSLYTEEQLKHVVEDYINNQNARIHLLFHDIKEKIIDEFNQYTPSLKDQLQKYINDKAFVSSQELPELMNRINWNHLKDDIEYLKIWLVYNKGKSLAYAWDSTKLSEQEARKKAELRLLMADD